jgi:replicative DNA helicase
MTGHYTPAAAFFDEWGEDVLHGNPPELWNTGFPKIEIGPGQVVLFGGCPGAGKTAFAMQMTVDALRNDHELRAMVLNVEMPPRILLERQLARLSGVGLQWIRHRSLYGQESRIIAALHELRGVSERLAFHTGKPMLADVARSIDDFGARLFVADYVQRIGTGDADTPPDKRTEIDNVMGHLRRFADAGLGVLAVSAVARQKGKGGSTYGGLGLASYRGSSELEYGGDACFILEAEEAPGRVKLSCEKNRHGERFALALDFDGARQCFTVADMIRARVSAGTSSVPGVIDVIASGDYEGFDNAGEF